LRRLILCFLVCFEVIPSVKSQQQSGKFSASQTPSFYEGILLPEFVRKVVTKNEKGCYQKWLKDYRRFCKKYGLLDADSFNVHQYVHVRLLHELVTSFSAKNGAMGPILKVPYYTLWGDFNPRNEIVMVENNQSLASLPPPKDSGKYLSLSNMERTPVYFISDLLADHEKYTNNIDTFASFGDGREREMAFVALASLSGYESWAASDETKVWSMVKVPFQRVNGEKMHLIYYVNNAEYSSEWYDKLDLKQEEAKLHDVAKHLDAIAKDEKKIQILSQIQVTEKASMRIQKAIDTYLNK